MTDEVETAAEEVVEKVSGNGKKVMEVINGGNALPPEPGPDHSHGKQPPSDGTVIVLSVLYIAGGAFMIGLGVTALRSMQKRRKERGK